MVTTGTIEKIGILAGDRRPPGVLLAATHPLQGDARVSLVHLHRKLVSNLLHSEVLSDRLQLAADPLVSNAVRIPPVATETAVH